MAKSLIAQIAARAKTIRSANPKMSWQSALKKAGAEFKGRQTTSKAATVKKTTKKPTAKVAAYYYGDGEVVGISDLKIGKKFEWIDGAEYLEVTYVGKTEKNKRKKPSAKYGEGGYLFQFDDKSYVDLSWRAVSQSLRSIPTKSKTVKPKRRVSGSTHKDTKSHNVRISVVSGNKPKKTVRPKMIKTDMDLNKLNGIIKMTTGKYYEVATGNNKGSVFYIQSTKKATKDTKKQYNVKFWEYRSGKLAKPFLGIISDAWINKRSIRPRGSVKSIETIGFAK